MNDSRNDSVPTFGNEASLPRVPLPTLEDSCATFLRWCTPLLTPAELVQTQAAVAELLAPDGPGRVLHAALQRYDHSDGVHSWLDEFWRTRYLGRRDRIALNANFFFLFTDSGQSQVERAAALVASAARFKAQIDAETLAPVLHRGQAQTMEQYKFLFSATRIPGAVQDTSLAPYTPQWPGPSTARHIVVFFRGNMFALDVVDPDGRPHTPADVATGLRAVMAAGATPAAPGISVGHLTTMARADWAATRQVLSGQDPTNADLLDTLETALFCLCLDDVVPVDARHAGELLLHGDSGNRWFDKAVSLIVFADGTAGINVEHCRLDGTTALAFVDALLAEPVSASDAAPGHAPAASAMEFVLDAGLRTDVEAAAASFARYAADTATTTLRFEGLGADRIKRLSMSPDAFVQLAYQLTHHRTKGHIGATYESIATRQYRHGRVSPMRVVTPQVLQFVSTMSDPEADAAVRAAAFRSAADAHTARAKQCQVGGGPEQHLWELQLIQRRHGPELGVLHQPALYDTPGWLIMRNDYLSTSSAPSSNIEYFGFGSTSTRCIGIGYVLLPDRLSLYLTTPGSVGDQMRAFADELPNVIAELLELLVDAT